MAGGDRWWTNWVEKDPVVEHRRKSRALSGEKRLCLAVFRDALKKKDLSWVESLESHPYSFNHLCETLEIDASKARAVILNKIQ